MATSHLRPPNEVDENASEFEPLLTNKPWPRPQNKKTWKLLWAFASLIAFAALVTVLVVIRSEENRKRITPPILDWNRLPGPQPGLRNPSYLARGRHGAVATEEEHCSDIGVDVLRDGGTATDAAIASAICIGTLNMFSSGIGGGGFLVVKPAKSKLCHGHSPLPNCSIPAAIDFRETAPTGSTPDMFKDKPLTSVYGGRAVGVPGELRGFEAAYKTYGGGVSWKRLFEPSIQLAKGWRMGPELARRLQLFGTFILQLPEWSTIFAPYGTLLREGEIISRPQYAKTLQAIADHGADAFYHGHIADSIVKTVKLAGGLLTKDDLATYTTIPTPALVSSYRNRTLYTSRAPSSGPILIHLLKTLEHYNLPEDGRSALSTHRFVEALKFAFARRTEIGDPAYADVQQRIDQIMSDEIAHETFKNITDDATHQLSYYMPEYSDKEAHGTTSISAVDAAGSAVTITSTVNLIFGSRVLDANTGVILNDEMNDFATPGVPDAFGLYPSPYNFPQAGKRPLSSMSPMILDDENGDFMLSLGGSGGSRIFGAITQALLNVDWGHDLSSAIEEPRLHDQLLPPVVTVEAGYPKAFIQGLKDRGHNVTVFDINLGLAEVHGVMNVSGWLYGASDSRKNGIAAAY